MLRRAEKIEPALKCSVVEQKPTVATMKLVGTTVYKTQAEAEIALKADKICSPK